MMKVGLYYKQDGIHCQGTHAPPQRFLYLTETKSWKWEEKEEKEKELEEEEIKSIC